MSLVLAITVALSGPPKWEAITGPQAEKQAGVHLTLPGELGYYGGSEVQQVYQLLAATPGWWQAEGELTPEQFTGLLILHEASLLGPRAELLITEVVARHLWAGGRGGNAPYCPSSPCLNGAFNFWARYSQSAHHLVDAYVNGTGQLAEYPGPNLRAQVGDGPTLRRAALLGTLALHPPAAWGEIDNDAPFGWGNQAGWVGPLVYHAGDFVIYTPNQAACHRVGCWP